MLERTGQQSVGSFVAGRFMYICAASQKIQTTWDILMWKNIILCKYTCIKFKKLSV